MKCHNRQDTIREEYISPCVEIQLLLLENGFAASGVAGIDPLESPTTW